MEGSVCFRQIYGAVVLFAGFGREDPRKRTSPLSPEGVNTQERNSSQLHPFPIHKTIQFPHYSGDLSPEGGPSGSGVSCFMVLLLLLLLLLCSFFGGKASFCYCYRQPELCNSANETLLINGQLWQQNRFLVWNRMSWNFYPVSCKGFPALHSLLVFTYSLPYLALIPSLSHSLKTNTSLECIGSCRSFSHSLCLSHGPCQIIRFALREAQAVAMTTVRDNYILRAERAVSSGRKRENVKAKSTDTSTCVREFGFPLLTREIHTHTHTHT